MLPVNSAPTSFPGTTQGPLANVTSDVSASSLVASTSGSSVGVGSIDPGLSLPGTTATVATPAPFADLLEEAVGQVQKLEDQANSSIEGLISGKGVDVHEVMIASQEASMGFELVLSLRNKALAAYQQVMGMQF